MTCLDAAFTDLFPCMWRKQWLRIWSLMVILFTISSSANSNATGLKLALWEPFISNADTSNDGSGGIFAMLGLYLITETFGTELCFLNQLPPLRTKVKRQNEGGYYWDEEDFHRGREDQVEDDDSIVSSYLTMAIKRNPGIYYKYCRHNEGAFASSALCLGDSYDGEGAPNPIGAASAAVANVSLSKPANDEEVEFFNSEFPGTTEGISTPIDRIWLILFPLLEAYLKVFSESSGNNIFCDAVWVYNRETNQARFGYKFRHPNAIERAGVYLKFEEARWTFAIGQAHDLTLGIAKEKGQVVEGMNYGNQSQPEKDTLCEQKGIQRTSHRTIRDYVKMAENVALYMGWTTRKDFCFDVAVGLWDASLSGEVIINAIETDQEISQRYAEFCIPRMSKRKYLALDI